MSLPYYPMYPRDFYEGTQRMTLELKGAYIMLLNLIYTRNGPVDDEEGYLARYVGCSIRKWQKLRLELIGLGKIIAEDGMIRNSRADEELLKRASYVDQKRENRARPNKNKAQESQPRTTRVKPEPEPEPHPEGGKEEAIASSKKPREPTSSRLPADWTLPDDWLAEARRIAFKAKMPLNDEEIQNEADKFRDYWHGVAGAKARKCDWLATWRTWVRNGLERRASRRNASGNHSSGPVSQHGRGSMSAAAIRRQFERQDQPDLSERTGSDDLVARAGDWRRTEPQLIG